MLYKTLRSHVSYWELILYIVYYWKFLCWDNSCFSPQPTICKDSGNQHLDNKCHRISPVGKYVLVYTDSFCSMVPRIVVQRKVGTACVEAKVGKGL